jgi:hypothetical protein
MHAMAYQWTVGTKGVVGTTGVTECEGDEGEVGGENPVSGRTSRPECVDILRMSGVTRQLETFENTGKCERDMECHVTKGGSLSSADITQAVLTRCYATGKGRITVR